MSLILKSITNQYRNQFVLFVKKSNLKEGCPLNSIGSILTVLALNDFLK